MQGAALAGGLGALGIAMPESVVRTVQATGNTISAPASFVVENNSGTYTAYSYITGQANISGGSDAQPVIQGALNAVNNLAGGSVFLREGTYYLGNTITIPNNCSLIGVNPRSSILQANSSTMNAIVDMTNQNFAMLANVFCAFGAMTNVGAVGVLVRSTNPLTPCRFNRLVDVSIFAPSPSGYQAGLYMAQDTYWNLIRGLHVNGIANGIRLEGANGHGCNANLFHQTNDDGCTSPIVLTQYSDVNLFSDVSLEGYSAYGLDIGGIGNQFIDIQLEAANSTASLMRLTSTSDETYVRGHSISPVGSNTVTDLANTPYNDYRITVNTGNEPVKLVQSTTTFGKSSTGSGFANLSHANCPATNLNGPYTWLKVVSPDGSTVYIPAWK